MNKSRRKMIKQRVCCVGMGMLLAAGATAQAQWAYKTNIIDPNGLTSTHPAGVYASNITGNYYDSQNYANGFLFNGSTYTTLNDPLAAETFLGGIDGTNIVGTYRTQAGNGFSSHGFLYNGSTWANIDYPGAILTLAYGVSGNFVVGLYNTSGNQDAWGYLYNMTNGSFVTLNDPVSSHGQYQGTYALGIDGTNIVGAWHDSTNNSHGFLYNMVTSNYVTLDPPWPMGQGAAISGMSGNLMAGYYYDTNGLQHGFLFNGTTWETLDVPGAHEAGIGGIHGSEVVGTWDDGGGKSYGFSAAPVAAAEIITNLSIPNGLGTLAVNPNLNRIYLSGQGEQPVAVDGAGFSQSNVGAPGGDGVDVDLANNNFWEADLFSGTASAWNTNNTVVTNVPLSACPTGVNVDSTHRVAWVSAQCGGGNDPIWPIDADTFAILHAPIGSGGIQGPTQVNPTTGRFYFAPSGVSKRINPSTYAVTLNAFGTVIGVDPTANYLYAITNSTATNGTLQIINGVPDPEVILTNVSLSFSFGYPIGVNPAVGRIYIGATSSNFIAVLNATNGALLETIVLGTNVTSVGSIAVDAVRGRVYAIASTASSADLFVIQDMASPAIVSGPSGATVGTGGTATLSVTADGYPLSYQWSLNGTAIAGATDSTLTLANVSAGNVGRYTVTISNGYGTNTSQSVDVSLLDLKMFAGLILDGPSGAKYEIQSTPSVGPPSWTTLTNVTVGALPYTFIDYNSPYNAKQFYRAVLLSP